jgi:hypothetical protein
VYGHICFVGSVDKSSSFSFANNIWNLELHLELYIVVLTALLPDASVFKLHRTTCGSVTNCLDNFQV